MFENRSFDNMLGMLYPASSAFDGLTGNESNTYRTPFGSHTVQVTNKPAKHGPYVTPDPDPGESFDDMSKQISGGMAGFAQNYFDIHPIAAAPGDIMFYFTPGEVQVTSAIAKNYAVCDQWFASAPVQTFPNRMLCHCGTPGTHRDIFGKVVARVNDLQYAVRVGDPPATFYGAVPETSIFQLLDGGHGPNPANWKVYFHDAPLSAINQYVYQAFLNKSPCVASYDASDYNPPYGTSFQADLASGNLPAYAFIEPRYFGNYSSSGRPASSNHPGSDSHLGIGDKPIDVRYGEMLLFDIFTTLARYPEMFDTTLLIVTYDEHGGVYDHRMPNTAPFAPSAVSPFPTPLEPFNYDRFGVRVPTFFVHSSIPQGTIFRPPRPGSGPYYPFDHTSILSTLREQFGLPGPLTPRDAAAPTLAGLIQPGAALRSNLELPREVHDWVAAIGEPPGKPAPQKTPEEHNQLMAARIGAKMAAEKTAAEKKATEKK
jgi:phospholipase C